MNLYYLIQSTDKFEGKKIDPFGSTVSFPDIVFEEGSTFNKVMMLYRFDKKSV